MTSIRPGIRAVLVNYRCADHIEARLRSGVFTSADEIVIVDNASDPERVTAWKSAYGVTPLLLQENVGFAAAVNEAVRVSITLAPILLLNPDAELDAEGLAHLVSSLEPGVDGVAPVLIGVDGKVQVGSAGGPLTLGSVAAYSLFVSFLLPQVRGVFLTRRQVARGGAADWLCMACLLVAPDVFSRFGTIPEDEIVYGEDLAWGTSATALGAQFTLLPNVFVRHEQGVSGGGARWQGALQRLLRRRLGPWQGRLAIGVFRVGVIARAGVRRVRR